MNFNIFGIGKENPAINSKDDKQNEKNFGIKKGEKIGPLSKDTISISVITPEQDLEQTIWELAKNCRGSKEIFTTTIKNIAMKGTEKNPELLERRIEILKKFNHDTLGLLQDLMFLEFTGNENTSFLLDNLEEIKNIFERKQISKKSMFASPKNILSKITQKNYKTFLECAKKEEFTGDDFGYLVIYKSRPHEIKFGNETASVSSQEVISLLTGEQSISTLLENNYDKFEETVNRLISKDYQRDSQQCYYKIAEGILSQKPELAKIGIGYIKYADSVRNRNLTKEEYASAMEEFFNDLEQKGILKKEIELKTIFPDENALLNPESTLNLFLKGETTSKKTE